MAGLEGRQRALRGAEDHGQLIVEIVSHGGSRQSAGTVPARESFHALMVLGWVRDNSGAAEGFVFNEIEN